MDRGLLAEAHPLGGRVCVCVCVCVCVAEAMVPPVMGHSGPNHGDPHESAVITQSAWQRRK